jgi:predicted ATPase
MRTLEKLTIKGFKSIREQTLELDRLNVFIGGNGVGKSNLIGVFSFLQAIVEQRLSKYTALRGGADSVLHFGRKTTEELFLELDFNDGNERLLYQIRMQGTDNGELTVEQETTAWSDGVDEPLATENVAYWTRESGLKGSGEFWAKTILEIIRDFQIYHFHDTSETSPIRTLCDLEDNHRLRPKGENLAAFLFFLKLKHPDHFSLIEATIQQVAPFFGGFNLQPSRLNEDKIQIEWEESGHPGYFNGSALSDGTLRFICLCALLLQPELPTLLVLDEPELGLHPAAIALLADLLVAAAEKTQIIVATQSVTLVNQLTPEQVWTVNREGDQSVFTKLDQTDYSTWLDDYALGELWEKNLINARP